MLGGVPRVSEGPAELRRPRVLAGQSVLVPGDVGRTSEHAAVPPWQSGSVSLTCVSSDCRPRAARWHVPGGSPLRK